MRMYVRNNQLPEYEEDTTSYCGTDWDDDDNSFYFNNNGVIEIYDEFLGNWMPVQTFLELGDERYYDDYDDEEENMKEEYEKIPAGWYFVTTKNDYAPDDGAVIIESEPHIILAYYLGDGDWSGTFEAELLHGINYKMIPVKFPELKDF